MDNEVISPATLAVHGANLVLVNAGVVDVHAGAAAERHFAVDDVNARNVDVDVAAGGPRHSRLPRPRPSNPSAQLTVICTTKLSPYQWLNWGGESRGISAPPPLI